MIEKMSRWWEEDKGGPLSDREVGEETSYSGSCEELLHPSLNGRIPPYGREDVARAMPGSLGCGMICTAGTSRALNPGLDRRDRGVAP